MCDIYTAAAFPPQNKSIDKQKTIITLINDAIKCKLLAKKNTFDEGVFLNNKYFFTDKNSKLHPTAEVLK